jgi:hypothetical protein
MEAQRQSQCSMGFVVYKLTADWFPSNYHSMPPPLHIQKTQPPQDFTLKSLKETDYFKSALGNLFQLINTGFPPPSKITFGLR